MDNHACACNKLIDYSIPQLISWDNVLVNNTNATAPGCVSDVLLQPKSEQRPVLAASAAPLGKCCI
jgi:hypothetical protein